MSSRPSDSRFLWQLWPARSWPFTAGEERLFVDGLAKACAAEPHTGTEAPPRTNQRADPDLGGFDRGDATAVLNSLRCGLPWGLLAGFVPGVDPCRLLAAYRALDKARAVSVSAFEQLLADPSSAASSDGLTVAAARVAPVASARLVAAQDMSDVQADAVVSELRETRAVVGRLVVAAERRLEDPDADPAVKVRSGRDLYDPVRSGLWSHPLFIPDRVGSLVPVRAASLLAALPDSDRSA